MKQTIVTRFHNFLPESISNRLHANRCSHPRNCVRLAIGLHTRNSYINKLQTVTSIIERFALGWMMY